MKQKRSGLLIIHGFTSSLDCVRGVDRAAQALGLSTRMPILTGHGQESPDALRGVTWRDWVADGELALRELLEQVDQAIVFGHSVGGLVALTLAADHSDVIDSLVLAAAGVQFASPLAPGRPFYFLAPVAAGILDKLDMPPVYADAALAKRDTNYPWAPSDALLSVLAFSKRTRQRLPEVSLPTLILQSRNDSTVAPESAEIIHERIATPAAQKRIVWFEETEHEMFRDCEREDAIAAVVSWLQERCM